MDRASEGTYFTPQKSKLTPTQTVEELENELAQQATANRQKEAKAEAEAQKAHEEAKEAAEKLEQQVRTLADRKAKQEAQKNC